MNQLAPITAAPPRGVVAAMADRFGMDPRAFEATVRATCIKPDRTGREATREEFAAFLLVAKEYGLNPLTREIYAFADKGAVVPIVSIDGWSNIINSHPQFDGMQFVDELVDGEIVAITCRIHRKDRQHPTEATEYLAECKRDTIPWNKWPRRMLRHKAMIQAARYAFGFAGIYDPDEGERIRESVAASQVVPLAQRLAGGPPMVDRAITHHIAEEVSAEQPEQQETGVAATQAEQRPEGAGEAAPVASHGADGFPGDDPVARQWGARASTDQAYCEGVAARRDGRQRRALPGDYRDRPDEASAWEDGWTDEDRAMQERA